MGTSFAAHRGVQPGKAAELRMHARARPRRTRNACAAGVQKWRFAGVETAPPCPLECLRACLSVPWSLSTLHASVRRSQRLLRSFWQTGDRGFRQPTSTLSRPRSAGRPARLPCSSCCRRRCTSIYTVPTLVASRIQGAVIVRSIQQDSGELDPLQYGILAARGGVLSNFSACSRLNSVKRNSVQARYSG